MSGQPEFTSEIRDGIEFFDCGDGNGFEQCARCGSSVGFDDCWNCGGDGTVEVDWGDDLCYSAYERRCEYCAGRGGRYVCCSSREYCEANPMPERAHIASPALPPSTSKPVSDSPSAMGTEKEGV